VEKAPFLRELECTGAVYFREDKQKLYKLQGKVKSENSLFCISMVNTARKVGVKLQKGRLRLEFTSEI